MQNGGSDQELAGGESRLGAMMKSFRFAVQCARVAAKK